jgi:hypothetical protein
LVVRTNWNGRFLRENGVILLFLNPLVAWVFKFSSSSTNLSFLYMVGCYWPMCMGIEEQVLPWFRKHQADMCGYHTCFNILLIPSCCHKSSFFYSPTRSRLCSNSTSLSNYVVLSKIGLLFALALPLVVHFTRFLTHSQFLTWLPIKKREEQLTSYMVGYITWSEALKTPIIRVGDGSSIWAFEDPGFQHGRSLIM